MSNLLEHVAIIGAGLGGCALALALSVQRIPVTVFESRSPEAEVFASGVILTPNGLRILERLSVFARIKDRCYLVTHRTIRDQQGEIVSKAHVADESLYGYRNHRVWRRILLDEMREMLIERSVLVEYRCRFNGVISESREGVAFRINDSERHASLLIGSDGIYSSVRKYIAPDVEPQYTGIVGVLSHIRWSSVDWPSEDYERNATLQGRDGAIFYIAEDPQAKDIMVGTQVNYAEQSRESLAALQADKAKLAEFFRNLHAGQGVTARSIIDQVCQHKDDLWIWPYLRMPRLPRWYSAEGRVILVGDGAHALPPSSGQGVNQALEDVHSLAMLLVAFSAASLGKPGETEIAKTLAFWQEIRQRKIDAVFDWATNSQNVDRLPEAERQKLKLAGKLRQGDDMSWLYGSDIDEDVSRWVAKSEAE